MEKRMEREYLAFAERMLNAYGQLKEGELFRNVCVENMRQGLMMEDKKGRVKPMSISKGRREYQLAFEACFAAHEKTGWYMREHAMLRHEDYFLASVVLRNMRMRGQMDGTLGAIAPDMETGENPDVALCAYFFEKGVHEEDFRRKIGRP